MRLLLDQHAAEVRSQLDSFSLSHEARLESFFNKVFLPPPSREPRLLSEAREIQRKSGTTMGIRPEPILNASLPHSVADEPQTEEARLGSCLSKVSPPPPSRELRLLSEAQAIQRKSGTTMGIAPEPILNASLPHSVADEPQTEEARLESCLNKVSPPPPSRELRLRSEAQAIQRKSGTTMGIPHSVADEPQAAVIPAAKRDQKKREKKRAH